jgi:4-amino-4-deoxy-L-arabinose transferase-like glycosyltransferase
MRRWILAALLLSGIFGALVLLHFPLLRLPYFWDEAGYYVPAALDIYSGWRLVPESTLPTGHTPLVMIYLALAWKLFGFSPLVTRTAMLLTAAATVAATYALARRVTGREPAVWAAALLALSPMFFAQSTMVFLDLPAALFTTLAVIALLDGRMLMFAVTASLAVLTKETAAVLLPVAWVFQWRRRAVGPTLASGVASAGSGLTSSRPGQAPALRGWIALVVPLAPLVAWTLYYHHKTGFWTGNAEYLQFNLYSTLNPGRFFWTLLRRLYEVFIGGFNWLLVVGAALGIWWGKKRGHGGAAGERPAGDFFLMAAGLVAAYILMLSVVGGAVLPRYLLPIVPLVVLAAGVLVWRAPRALARATCGVTLAGFVTAWSINPPYPFPYEDNLAYADFIRLHQDAAGYLESRPAGERILTAWPATDELARPFLGYVHQPLRAVPLEGFTARDFEGVSPDGFDLLYVYSRKWEPPNNWLPRLPIFLRAQERYFGYGPQVSDEELASRFQLRLLRQFERRGQWVRIYEKESGAGRQESEVRRKTALASCLWPLVICHLSFVPCSLATDH